MRPNDYDDNFNRSFDRAMTAQRRWAGFALAVGVAWIAFLIGAISTVIWLVGRFMGAW